MDDTGGLLDKVLRPMAERIFFAGFWWGAICGLILGVALYGALHRSKALGVILPLVLVGLVYLATGGGRSVVPLPLLPSLDKPVKPKDEPKPKPPDRPRLPWRAGPEEADA